VAARRSVFDRWPSATTAARFHKAAGALWPQHSNEVLSALSSQPDQAVLFCLLSLQDPRLAWETAHSLELEDNHVWVEVVKAYQKLDPIGSLVIHRRLVADELAWSDAQHYRKAARRLATMRKLAAGTDFLKEVDAFISELRSTHKRRPRLQLEFDRAHLPASHEP
jgi:uncharacterized Zn finger protein